MDQLPWLDYTGQTTQELLACGETHRVDSVVVAFDEAIGNKDPLATTIEERVVLAVEALEREVNNGGFHQFFTNSSCEYVPAIVDSLHAIGAAAAAELTADAIAALRLDELTADAVLDAVETGIDEKDEAMLEALDLCDQRYYEEVGDLSQELFAFIRTHAAHIRI